VKFCFAGKDKYFDPYWLLEYLGKAKMRVKLFSSNWLYIIDRVALKKATNCSFTLQLRNIGKLLLKWEGLTKKISQEVEEEKRGIRLII
jgi:hypothetical protein